MKQRFFVSALLCAFSACVLISCASSIDVKLKNARDRNLPKLEKQLSDRELALGAPLFIRVFKEEKTLEIWTLNQSSGRYELFKSYGICAMSGTIGPKSIKGDLQAPEGFYDVTRERLWPGSKYHLAMNIGYPNVYDEAHGRTGHALMIHGDCQSDGCFAMTTKFIEEIYVLVEASLNAGQDSIPVHIFPFRMTPENMAAHVRYAPWVPFWENLRQGYDLFEQTHIPPAVSVSRKKYTFGP